MSQYLSANNSSSGSGTRSRSGGRDRPDDRRSRSPSGQRPSSSRGNHGQISEEMCSPNYSQTFRFTVFVLHYAISLLESDSGRAALIKTGHKVYQGWGRRDRKEVVFRGDVRRHPELMDRAVDQFLRNIRNDPPNMIISSRLKGEGVVQRQTWANVKDEFEVKWGVVFSLNKTVIDNAIAAAEGGYTEEFQSFLFLMGMATAHELVHAFVGVLTGDSTTLTPPPVNFPRQGTSSSAPNGESGRFFEGELTGFLVEAYYREHNLGNQQAGKLVARARGTEGTVFYHIDKDWMLARLSLNFGANNFPAPVNTWKPTRVNLSDIAMEAKRQPSGEDFGERDLTAFLTTINNLAVERVGSAELREIMSMAVLPKRIRTHA